MKKAAGERFGASPTAGGFWTVSAVRQ